MVTVYSLQELQGMGAMEVRAIAGNVRKSRRDNAIAAVELQRAGKDAQIAYILTGIAPASAMIPAPEPTSPATVNAPEAIDLARLIAEAVAGLIPAQQATLDVDAVKGLIAQEFAKLAQPTVTVQVTHANGRVSITKDAHKQYAELLELVSTGRLWIIGEAGNGKTYSCMQAAKELDAKAYRIPCNGQTTKSDFVGFVSPITGKYVSTGFRQWWESDADALLILDEADAMPSEVALVLNAALDNSTEYPFPDATVSMGKGRKYVVACANTYGYGATGAFTGRSAQDHALLDRFDYTLIMGIDEALEEKLAGRADLAGAIRNIRNAAKQAGSPYAIGQRRTMAAAKLLAKGWSLERAMGPSLWSRIPAATAEKICANMA